MTDALDWVIVGGGIHGVHVAVRLLGEAGVPRSGIRLVDPGKHLLDSWRRCTANTGMQHLRSPAVHHLDVDPWSLLDFAGANRRGRGAAKGMFAPPYLRPSVDLFSQHCDDIIDRFGLDELHIRARAESIELVGEGAEVHLDVGGQPLRTRRVLLAMGGSAPHWPEDAQGLREDGFMIRHVFEPGFCLKADDWPERVAVVGGGISAAQVALRLAKADKQVHFVARHALRKHQFDSDPGWIGPKNMRRFSATSDLAQRRQMIADARHRGSLPPDVHRALLWAIREERITHHHGQPLLRPEGEQIAVELAEETLTVGAVLLATGFSQQRPGGAVVDQLIHRHALPCAACGYPVVDTHLRWHPSVFVTGPLAELEVGPVSRNIVGARKAANRILEGARA